MSLIFQSLTNSLGYIVFQGNCSCVYYIPIFNSSPWIYCIPRYFFPVSLKFLYLTDSLGYLVYQDICSSVSYIQSLTNSLGYIVFQDNCSSVSYIPIFNSSPWIYCIPRYLLQSLLYSNLQLIPWDILYTRILVAVCLKF